MNRTERRALERFARAAKTRRFEQGQCLNCAAPLSGLTGPDSVDPGSIMVCAYCSHIMEWTGERLAELSNEAALAIAGDPEVLAVVEAVAAVRLTRPTASCKACGASMPYGQIRCDACGKPFVFPDD